MPATEDVLKELLWPASSSSSCNEGSRRLVLRGACETSATKTYCDK